MRREKYLFGAVILFINLFFANCAGNRSSNTPVDLDLKDPILQEIYNLQTERNGKGLLSFMNNSNSSYRYASTLAFGSVQDTTLLDSVALRLKDSNEQVRIAAAFALGQMRHPAAVEYIVKSFIRDSSAVVKAAMLEAMGKIGSIKNLNQIVVAPGYFPDDSLMASAQALSIYNFALRNIVIAKGTEKMIEFIKTPDAAQYARFVAANYLYRAKDIDLTPYGDILLQAVTQEKEANTRMFLILGLAKSKTPSARDALNLLFKTEKDYRVRCNILRGLGQNFAYDSVKTTVFQALKDGNHHVMFAASEFFVQHGIEKDAATYLQLAEMEPNWQIRANLYKAANKAYPAFKIPSKQYVADIIIKKYNASKNIYEKAALMNALSEFAWSFKFIKEQAFPTDSTQAPTLQSSFAIEALANIFTSPGGMGNFGESAYQIRKQYDEVFKRCIASGDPALISIVAPIIKEPKYNFKAVYTDIGFMNKALNKLKLPLDIEAYQGLKEAIESLSGKKIGQTNTPKLTAIDFALIQSLPSDMRVQITTSKGNIILKLLPTIAPASVAAFAKTIQTGYYNGKTFHRVVPNFVIQGGCSRGDGYSGADFSLPSEFSPLHYDSGGWVGLASAGKDTEGNQFFITHAPALHLDGRYTIFAKVIEGMDIVHKIQIGDIIEKIEIK